MSDSRDIEALKEAYNRAWITREQGHYCFVQCQDQQRSPLDIALECSYLNQAQIAQLRSPGQVSAPTTQALNQEPKVGQDFDGYHIVQELGRGGMGAVFRGQKDGFDFALKVLLPDNLDGERFRREAELLAQVDQHPNIVRIHSFKQAGLRRYIVFDYMNGGDLKGRLKAVKTFSEESALQLLSQLANALSHVHKHGILHRDLKPENILFNDDRPQISDFGLAYSVSLETLSRTGAFLGTAAYMAPEQIDNLHSELCPATDTWALGVILYELLSGEKPFPAQNAIQYAKHIVTKPTPRIRSLNPEVSEQTESLILKALEKETGDRFQSALEFEQACLAALKKTNRSFSIPSLIKRARTNRRRVVTLAIFILMFTTLYFYGRNIDDLLFDWRVSPELKAQSALVKTELTKTEKQLPSAVAQLMLLASGFRPQEPTLAKNNALLVDFDTFIQELESIPRLFRNPELERLRQRRSALYHYWSSCDAISGGQQIALDARLSNEWRILFRANQLFLEQNYKDAKKEFIELGKQTPPRSEFQQLSYLGLALCESKQKKWRRAWASSAKISTEASRPVWFAHLLLHLNEQEALDLLLNPPNTQKSERERIKDLEQCWSKLLVKLEGAEPGTINRYWDTWNTQINKALKKGKNRQTIMLYIDFLARYWCEKPAVIKPKLDHKALKETLRNLFQQSQVKKQKNSHGKIFNHFLSVRQFDRSFKMDLTFLIQDQLNIAGVLGKVETEIDWLKSITRLAYSGMLEYREKNKKRQSSFSAILFQTSLAASRQGVFIPLDQAVLLQLDKAKLLDDAVDSSHVNDIYPHFWRAQLNPFDFKKAARRSPGEVIRLYNRMYKDIKAVLEHKNLSRRFRAILLTRKAQWHSSVISDLVEKNISLRDLSHIDLRNLNSIPILCMEEAIQHPNFMLDRTYYEYSRFISATNAEKSQRGFERAILELEKRQVRTVKRNYYVGRTLGEAILPVVDFEKEKSRYIVSYLSALRLGKSYAKAIDVAMNALELKKDTREIERILAHCLTAQKRWSDLENILAKKEPKDRREILEKLFSEFKEDVVIYTELKKRYEKPL